MTWMGGVVFVLDGGSMLKNAGLLGIPFSVIA